jgi:hypothetical protein
VKLLGNSVYHITNDDGSNITKEQLLKRPFKENEDLLTELLKDLDKLTNED